MIASQRWLIPLSCLALALLLIAPLAATAHGQDAPPAPATDLVKAVDEAPSEDTTTLSGLLGGTLNTGNTEAWQVNTGADFLLARMPSQLVASVAFAFGRANPPGDDADQYETTVKNLRSRVRYDYFLTKMDALFAATAFRWDPFAGIDARVQGELGYARYLLKTDVHRFWLEGGYDLTFDDYHPLPNPDFMLDEDGDPVDPDVPRLTPNTTEVTHSARLFVGYDNRINEMVTYLGGLEALMNVESPRDMRVNMDNALRSKIGGNFSLEIKLSFQFDNVPVPGAKKLDTQTIGSVIYSLI
jgi:putative salt-induced outer membrane protein YdiY